MCSGRYLYELVEASKGIGYHCEIMSLMMSQVDILTYGLDGWDRKEVVLISRQESYGIDLELNWNNWNNNIG